MTEFELINECFNGWPYKNAGVSTGIGDDCLVWQNSTPLVVSVDTAVEGVHFPAWASPAQVAQRCFLPAVSDLAAMAAKPAFFTLAMTLPERCRSGWAVDFGRRLNELSQAYEIMLAGGDTTKGEQLTITVSVHGTAPTPILRRAAQVGDEVFVTGVLGQAAAALPYVLARNEDAAPPEWVDAYWQPKPPVAFAQKLTSSISSAIDLSDGLMSDARHIAEQSQVSLALQLDQIPLDDALKNLGERGLQMALSGGDDYQLCFTASPTERSNIERIAAEMNVKLSCIGQVWPGPPRVDWYNGEQKIELDWRGFQHF